MTSSRVDTSVSGAPSGGSLDTSPSKNQPADLTSVDISRETLKSESERTTEKSAGVTSSERDPSLGVVGTDLDAERAKHAEPILGLDLEKVAEDRKAAAAAIAARHEELQNAGFEDAAAPAGIPSTTTVRSGTGVALAGRSAEQQREILNGESLLLTGKSKKKTGNIEIDEFIEQHPELVPLVAKIQQELAAVERAKSAGESGLESKSNLEAALDRISTLLEGQPLAPQLRIGDRTAKSAIIELLTGGKPEEVKVAEVVIDDIQRRLLTKNAHTNSSITREELERFAKEAERIGRFEGLTLAEGSTSRAAAEVGVVDARTALEKALKESGCDTPEVRELLTTIERQAAERERMIRVSERVYELQLQVSTTEGRHTHVAAVEALKDYLSDQRDLLERNRGYREELAKHQAEARSEGTKLLRSCREAAASIEQASHYSFFEGTTNEAAIFKALEGRSHREVALIDALFREDFGKGEYQSVEGLIRGEMEDEDLARALKAFRGEGAASGLEPRSLAPSALANVAANIDTAHLVDAVMVQDTARTTALTLRSAATSGADPVIAMVGVLEAAKARGLDMEALTTELQNIGFDPTQAVGRDPADTGAELSQGETIGRALIEEMLGGGTLDDNKLFAYAQLRAMAHGGRLGALEALEQVPTEQIARVNATHAAEMRGLESFFSRHPETKEQLEQVLVLATTQVRTEQINQEIAKLAQDVGVREYTKRQNPDLLKEAQQKLDAYLTSKRDVIASVGGHSAAVPVIVEQAKLRGDAMMRDVAGAVSKYNVATDHWFSFMADADTAADVLRGKSTEWLVLFKEEFQRVHGSNTAIGVASEILSGAEFDRVYSLMHRDRIGTTAADVEVAMSHWNGANRDEFVTAVKTLRSDEERAEFREVFNPRYARNHSITVNVPDPHAESGFRSEVHVARDFDQAVDYSFSGDGAVIAKAAFSGDDALVDAATVHEGLASVFDPASKGARALDVLRTEDGKLDIERIERAQVAYEKRYKSDIAKDIDAIDGLRVNEEPGKIWGKAILEGDEVLVAAAKVRSGVMGAGTENTDIRAVFTMSSELGDIVNQIEQGGALTPAQIAGLNEGRGLTRGGARAIFDEFTRRGYVIERPAGLDNSANAADPATPEMIARIVERNLPDGIRKTLATSGDEGAVLAAYVRLLEQQASHRARVEQIDKRYAEVFDGASLKKDLRGDLSDWDLRYVETLRGSGVVPRAYRYMDVCGGDFDGTEEAELRELTRGRSREDIEADRRELKRLFSRNLDSMLLGEVSGDLDFDISEDLRGRPETTEEKLAAAARRLAHEESGWGETWYRSHKEMVERYGDLTESAARGELACIDRSYLAFGTAADSFRGQKNATSDMIANVGATVVIVGGTVVVVTATGGGAIPLMCVAAGGGAARIGTKAALKGDAYGWEEGAVDVGVAAVDVAVMGITPFASVGQAASNQILLQGGKTIAARGGAAVISEEGAALAGKQALMQIGQGSRLVRVAAGSAQGAIDGALVAPLQTGVVTAMHEETWQNGFVDGLGTIAINGAMMAPVGAAMGAPFGGVLALKTPAQLKLGRPLKPSEAAEAITPRQPEIGVRSDLGEFSPAQKIEFTPRAREMLAARQESRGFITEGDRIDADLMSSSLSKSRSQKVIAQAKEAAKAGRMSDGEVQALEKQLRVDGKLTKFEARAVEKALNPDKFDEPITVMTRKMLDRHLKEVTELTTTLRKDLAREGITEVEAAALNTRLASIGRRLEALKGIERTMNETQAMAEAMKVARPTPTSVRPLDDRADGAIAKVDQKVRADRESSRPLDDRSESSISDAAAKRYVERNDEVTLGDTSPESSARGGTKDTESPAASSRSEEIRGGEPPASATEPTSPEVIIRQAKVQELDERIAAAEGYLRHEKALLEKALASSEPNVVEVAPGLKVPREQVEAGHRALQNDVETLRLQRDGAVADVKARQDLERLSAESQARSAERAAAVRERVARSEASAAEARRAEVARRMNERSAEVDSRAAEVRAEAEATLRRQQEIQREATERSIRERGQPIERYVPKTEKPKSDFDRIGEIDEAVVRNENYLNFLERKLASGEESINFDGFTMSRADVEANVQSLRQENIALAAERENLTRIEFAPRPLKNETRPVTTRESDSVSAPPRSGEDGGPVKSAPQPESPQSDVPFTAEPAPRATPRPQRQPASETTRTKVEVLEREVNPDLERLLAQIESMPPSIPEPAAAPVEIVEPSPAIAKRLTETQNKLAELEASHARYEGKRSVQEVIEEELQKTRQVLRSLDERASLQSDLKRAIREADEDAASIADIAARKNVRRELARLETRINGDEGDLDLGALQREVADLQSGMRSTAANPTGASPSRVAPREELSASETDQFLAHVFERNPDLYMSLASKVDGEGRLSLHSIRETYAENGLELPREFGGKGEIAPVSRTADEDGFPRGGDESSRDSDPAPRGGDDEGGGGTATMTKPKTEVKTEIEEPELEVATETPAAAPKPKVEEPAVKTAPKVEEKTEAPIAKPIEETETETATSIGTEPTAQPSIGPAFKLQARPNSNTKVVPKVTPENAAQTALQAGLARQTAQSTGTTGGTKYLDEPPPGRGRPYMGGGSGGTPPEQKREELEAKRPEVLEHKEPVKKVSAKEHEARKGIDKRRKLVGEDVDGTETFIQGDLKVSWEKLAD